MRQGARAGRPIPSDPGQLALEQPRQVGEGQGGQRELTAAAQAPLRHQARPHQGSHAAQGVAHQHHPLLPRLCRPEGRQEPLPLGLKHGLQIREALGQGFGPGRGSIAEQGSLDRLLVTAGMFHHQHGPAPIGQGRRQPAELVGAAAQARHQQHPGPPARLLAGPELQR